MAENDLTDAPVVMTACGRVRGAWADGAGSAMFLGIPYAEAPVVGLRFAAPKPKAPWEGTREATQFGPTPLRGEHGITLIPEHSIPGRDTLSVNVWTPTLEPGVALPVVVWIHGGGYVSGSPASPWYDGRAFVRDGVVFVSVSYRIGFTGFGWIEGTTQNRGVLDWICALEWVRDNIAAFGGDPGRVTIAGQSAGGGAVLTLLGAPAAAGLFHAGYAMSAALADASPEEAKKRARHLARLADVPADLAGFSSITEATLLQLQRKVTAPTAPHLLHDVHEMLRDGLLLGPVLDGEVVTESLTTVAAHGVNAAVPLVLGGTADELSGLFHSGGVLDMLPKHALLLTLGIDPAAAHRWLEHMGSAADVSTSELLSRYAADAVLRSVVPRVADARAASPLAGPTWTYSFAWHAEQPPYAGHCIDIPFAFDALSATGVDRVAGEHPPQQLADAVHGALVRFAQTDDPGWGEAAGGNGPTRVFDLPIRDEYGVYDAARALLPK